MVGLVNIVENGSHCPIIVRHEAFLHFFWSEEVKKSLFFQEILQKDPHDFRIYLVILLPEEDGLAWRQPHVLGIVNAIKLIPLMEALDTYIQIILSADRIDNLRLILETSLKTAKKYTEKVGIGVSTFPLVDVLIHLILSLSRFCFFVDVWGFMNGGFYLYSYLLFFGLFLSGCWPFLGRRVWSTWLWCT